jgi:hypothetical protein
MILQTTPDYETTNVPVNPWRRKFHMLVTSEKFDNTIMFCIILNMIQMMCYYEDMNMHILNFLNICNLILSFIFLAEATLKLIAFGKTYFDNGWNQFDFGVVVASIFDIIMGSLGGGATGFLSVAPKIAKLLRIARVARIIRLAGKA